MLIDTDNKMAPKRCLKSDKVVDEVRLKVNLIIEKV